MIQKTRPCCSRSLVSKIQLKGNISFQVWSDSRGTFFCQLFFVSPSTRSWLSPYTPTPSWNGSILSAEALFHDEVQGLETLRHCSIHCSTSTSTFWIWYMLTVSSFKVQYRYFDDHWRSLTYWDEFHCFFSWLIGHLLTISTWHPHRLATVHQAKYTSGKSKQRNIMNISSGRWALEFNDLSFEGDFNSFYFWLHWSVRVKKNMQQKGIHKYHKLGWIDNTASSYSFHWQSDFTCHPEIGIVFGSSRWWNPWGLWPSMRLIQWMRQWRRGSLSVGGSRNGDKDAPSKRIHWTLNHWGRSVPRSIHRGTMSSPCWRCIVLLKSHAKEISSTHGKWTWCF